MNDEQQPYDPIRWKAGVLILGFSVLFLLVLGRLFWVQVMHGAHYRDIAKRQYESKVSLRAERGKFYDRNGRDIAVMMKRTSFAADPAMMEKPRLVSELLAAAVGDSAQYYYNSIKNTKSRFVWLARGVNTAMYPDLDTLADPGLIRLHEPKRNFLYGPYAAQVLGTTNTENKGLTGLELQYNSILEGQSGFVIMQRDGRGRLRPGVNPEREAAQDGRGLELTIDIEFQRVAEEELRRGVLETGAVSGTVVAIEPSTGDILAMASMPSFNPNRLDKASPDAIRVRAITDQYEPGSTMKAITAAALLEERKIAPTDQVDGLGGQLQIHKHVVIDDHPIGKTTFAIALEQSSNVVFASVAQRLDDRTYYKYVRDFGFGIPSGIDLPGEIRGVLKRPNEFDATTKYFMAFGYELSATALQVLNAYATIANGGVMMEPRVVRAIRAPDGDVHRVIQPQRVRRVISESTAETLTKMLVGVVENGTGSRARIPGLHIAGKTGTAQQLEDGLYSQKSYTASFVGYYPADEPKVAMIVMLDRPKTSIYGGSTAAPIFRRVVQKTMTMLELDDATSEVIAASAEADTVIVPDIRGLPVMTADTVLLRLGLVIDSKTDTGVIAIQKPLAGARVERGTRIKNVPLPDSSSQHPYVQGLTLRQAITRLHDAGFEVVVQGRGRVVEQHWRGDTCKLTARE